MKYKSLFIAIGLVLLCGKSSLSYGVANPFECKLASQPQQISGYMTKSFVVNKGECESFCKSQFSTYSNKYPAWGKLASSLKCFFTGQEITSVKFVVQTPEPASNSSDEKLNCPHGSSLSKNGNAVFCSDSQHRPQGPLIIKSKTGVLLSEENYVDGLREGNFISRYENGQKHSEGQYHKGLRNGPYKEWNDKGVLIVDAIFKDEVPVSGSLLPAGMTSQTISNQSYTSCPKELIGKSSSDFEKNVGRLLDGWADRQIPSKYFIRQVKAETVGLAFVLYRWKIPRQEGDITDVICLKKPSDPLEQVRAPYAWNDKNHPYSGEHLEGFDKLALTKAKYSMVDSKLSGELLQAWKVENDHFVEVKNLNDFILVKTKLTN